MIENGIRIEEIIKKVNCEQLQTINNLSIKPSELCSILQQFPKANSLKNSAQNKLNEHDDMLQANQANLKCSSYANNIKQVISINSSFHERYHKLQKLSLHHILTKGKFHFPKT